MNGRGGLRNQAGYRGGNEIRGDIRSGIRGDMRGGMRFEREAHKEINK